MTPDRWHAVKNVFDAALLLDQSTRAAYLDRACAGDSSLRAEVEDLLQSDEHAGDFIEAPVVEAAPDLLTDDDAETLVGTVIGHYRILSRLGAGGMGEVYLAQHITLGRKVALKVMAPTTVATPRLRARFVREAQLIAALDHANVCRIYEVGTADGRDFISMEYIEGETLRRVIDGRALSVPRLMSIGLQTLDALQAAHARGIVHRDINANNIMVTAQGHVKVLDFGLAKLIEPEPGSLERDLTSSGAAFGTPSSMSPEQARGTQADQRSDVFSVGVVLYEMATGQTPFKRPSAAETMTAVINEPHTPVDRINANLPSGLVTVIDRALAKDVGDRYQSVQDMMRDLRHVELDAVPIRDMLRRARRSIAHALLPVALLGLGAAGLYPWPARGPESDPFAVHERDSTDTTSGEAHQLYLKGRYFSNRRSVEGYKKAIDYFRQAIDKDPTYARAYAGLADSYNLLGGWQVLPARDAYPKAYAAAKQALSIDESIAEAHTSLALFKSYSGDWQGAEVEFKRAIALNPNDDTPHRWYGSHLGAIGRLEEAMAETRRAQELDPLSLNNNTQVGRILYLMRQYDQAIAQFQNTLEMDSRFAHAEFLLGWVYEKKQMYPQALAAYEKASSLGAPGTIARIARVYALSGNTTQAQRLLDQLHDVSRRSYVSPYEFALVYAGLGDLDKALEWLERTSDEGAGRNLLKMDPTWDSLRPHKRFQELLARIGFPR